VEERHSLEQYFFDRATLDALVTFVADYARPCCVAAPMLGSWLEDRGSDVRILDVDERFATRRGFRRFDLYRLVWRAERFDLVVCDPLFFAVSLSQLFGALRVVAQHDLAQPMLVAYLARRREAILGTFRPFGLEPTGFFPRYVTVQNQEPGERSAIELFGNLGADAHARLRALQPGPPAPRD
jgi:hypothetical protein